MEFSLKGFNLLKCFYQLHKYSSEIKPPLPGLCSEACQFLAIIMGKCENQISTVRGILYKEFSFFPKHIIYTNILHRLNC